MAKFNVKQELLKVAYKIGLIKDYVIERGQSDIWEYRKWNSGVSECWGVFTTTNGARNTEGASYFSAHTGTYPAGLFIARPVLLSDPRWNWIGGFNQAATQNDKDGWYGYLWSFVNSPSHAGISINLYAIGKWK